MLTWILRQMFRPGVLIVVSIILLAAALLFVFQSEPGHGKPQPAAVRPGEHEIAFLYPATNMASWERFVAAVEHCRPQLESRYPGLRVVRAANPESAKALAAPEVALQWASASGRLVFRWYKLTSDWSPELWVEALLARKPPPLAIIGGNTTYWARELALQLAGAGDKLPEVDRPLLLLTTATADRVPVSRPGESEDAAIGLPLARWGEEGKRPPVLSGLYPKRTFRFCFTNRQMATAVTRFIWSKPELRPDSDPAFLVKWTDDSYSLDLFDGYAWPGAVLDHRAADNLLQQWAFVSGSIALGAHPATLAGWYTSSFRHEGNEPLRIDSSVGSFAAPNPYEAKVAQDLVAKFTQEGEGQGGRVLPRRPLLVITGQAEASRRFLREVARSAPTTARRFVVAMGDTIPFNTLYRDRLVTWPIQDLPFTAVFFCHRNPIDKKAGFHPRQKNGGEPAEPGSTSATSGTEDLLLFADVVGALSVAFARDGKSCSDAQQLADGLRAVRLDNGQFSTGPAGLPLFREDGQRRSATGENVVYLRPHFEGDRVLPEATIEVWSRQTSDGTSNVWQCQGSPLTVSYDEFKVHGDRSHGN
jgi:hypothetical protein